MHDCDKCKGMISLYIDHLLTDNEKIEFESHVKNCSKCEKELNEMRRLISLCGSLPEEDLPPNFAIKLHAALSEVSGEKPKGKISVPFGGRYAKVLSAAAACIAVVFLVKGALWWNGISGPDISDGRSASIADSVDNKTKPEKAADILSSGNSGAVSSQTNAEASGEAAAQKADTANDNNVTGSSTSGGAITTKSTDKTAQSFAGSMPAQKAPTATEQSSLKNSVRNSTSSDFTMAAIRDETADTGMEGIPVTFYRRGNMVITSVNPALEPGKLKEFAKVCGIEFTDASPEGILEMGESSGDIPERTSAPGSSPAPETAPAPQSTPSVIVLVCKLQEAAYDQFSALLKAYYQQPAVSIGQLETVDTTDRYRELKSCIAANVTQIEALKSGGNSDDAKTIDSLNLQNEQYTKELTGLSENSKYISLTIIVQK